VTVYINVPLPPPDDDIDVGSLVLRLPSSDDRH
jgi:hypothetical protein